MLPETYLMLAEREENYWWHRARRIMCAGLLRRYGLAPSGRWLDLGCGPGGNFALSKTLMTDIAIGLDLSTIALAEAKKRLPHISLVRADLSRPLPFADSKFDLVTIFNVLYHDWIASEADVVAEASRVLRPGGYFLITEPAFPILSREMDIVAMGRRRYHVADVVDWCNVAGLDVKYVSYFTSFGFPLLLGLKLFRNLRASKGAINSAPDMRPLNRFANVFLKVAALFEGFLLIRGLKVPLGTTIVCLAQKNASTCTP